MMIRHSFFIFSVVLVAALSACPSQALSKKESEQTGANLFRDKGCTYCHGATATGTTRGPSLADVRKRLKPEQISHQIVNGGQKMPSFKQILSQDEVDSLVSFLRAKHRPVASPVPNSAALSNPAQ